MDHLLWLWLYLWLRLVGVMVLGLQLWLWLWLWGRLRGAAEPDLPGADVVFVVQPPLVLLGTVAAGRRLVLPKQCAAPLPRHRRVALEVGGVPTLDVSVVGLGRLLALRNIMGTFWHALPGAAAAEGPLVGAVVALPAVAVALLLGKAVLGGAVALVRPLALAFAPLVDIEGVAAAGLDVGALLLETAEPRVRL